MWRLEKLKPSIANTITPSEDMADIKPYALELVAFLDEALVMHPDPERNRMLYANQPVSEMAALGMFTMAWAK